MLPLFDTLVKNVSKKELDKTSKEVLRVAIQRCTRQEMEIIYGLILSYCQVEKIPINYYPFQSKQTLEGIEFELDNLPTKLQHIVNKFVCKTIPFAANSTSQTK